MSFLKSVEKIAFEKGEIIIGGMQSFNHYNSIKTFGKLLTTEIRRQRTCFRTPYV